MPMRKSPHQSSELLGTAGEESRVSVNGESFKETATPSQEVPLLLQFTPLSTPFESDDQQNIELAPLGSGMVVPQGLQMAMYASGPLRAWSTVIGCCLLQFCTVGVISAFGATQTYYVQTYLSNESSSTVSWIGSIALFLNLAISPFSGYMFDRGYFRSVLVLGSFLFVLCFFMLSLAKPHQYYQIFLTQGIGMGVGAGLIYLPASAVVAQHFRQNKALAMGFVSSSSSLGGAVFSVAFNYLLHGHLSFGWAMRILAFIALGCHILGHALISLPPKAPTDLSSHPQTESGITVDSVNNPSQPIDKNSVERNPRSVSHKVAPRFMWDRSYVIVLLAGFVSSLGTWFPLFYVQLFAEQHGIVSEFAFYTIAIINVSNIPGRIIPNWFGDRFGALEVYIPCALCCGAIGFALLGCTTPYGVVLFSIFYGFFFGSTISLYLPMIASLTPQGADIGRRMGVSLFPVGVASLIGTPITGAVLGPHYIWWKGVTFASVVMLAGGSLLILVKLGKRKV